jgi:hypothetical protein
VYFRVDSIPAQGTMPVDGLGFPLRRGFWYVMSTRMKAPVVTNSPTQQGGGIGIALNSGTARDTTYWLRNGGSLFLVNIVMFGQNEVRPEQDVVSSSRVVQHN